MGTLEEAIQAYESLTSLQVVVHDPRSHLWQDLPWQRFLHSGTLCQRIKETAAGEERCYRFEVDDFRAEAHRYHEGRVHRCHAGLSEIAMPVLDDEGLLFVLFAGPFRPETAALLDYEAPPGPITIDASIQHLRGDQITLYRELLRQLGCRLRCAILDRKAEHEPTTASRRQQIEGYLSRHLSEPLTVADLARVLDLSADRCRHAVREVCGVGFAKLLRQIRLRSATSLLLNTDLPVDQVAIRCGLPDPSGFSRAFRETYGLSPGRWRRQNRG